MKDILKFNRPEWPWLMMGFIGCILTGTIMPVFAIFYGQVFAVSIKSICSLIILLCISLFLFILDIYT